MYDILRRIACYFIVIVAAYVPCIFLSYLTGWAVDRVFVCIAAGVFVADYVDRRIFEI